MNIFQMQLVLATGITLAEENDAEKTGRFAFLRELGVPLPLPERKCALEDFENDMHSNA